MKSNLMAAAAAATALFAACAAIKPAEMAQPIALQSGASVTRIEGIGGWDKGSFRAGAYAGAFTRSAQELSFFNVVSMRDGGSTFSLAGPEFASGVEARCTMRERTVTLDIVEFKPGPMAYACEFRSGGQRVAANFEVQESAPGFTNRQERRGAVMIDGAVLDIRSVHEIAGSILPVSAPIGYVFERNGAAMGSVQLNGDPVIHEAAAAGPAEHRAMLLAAVALSVFWDPANLES